MFSLNIKDIYHELKNSFDKRIKAVSDWFWKYENADVAFSLGILTVAIGLILYLFVPMAVTAIPSIDWIYVLSFVGLFCICLAGPIVFFFFCLMLGCLLSCFINMFIERKKKKDQLLYNWYVDELPKGVMDDIEKWDEP